SKAVYGNSEKEMEESAFLGLPKRAITNILSFLPPKERLTARLNKKLNEIEANSKFHVQELRIVEISHSFRRLSIGRHQDFYFSDQHHHSYNSLRKLISNTSIGSLTVALEAGGNLGQGSLLDKVQQLINEFNNVGSLTVQFEFFVCIMDKSFFLGLVESCRVVTLIGVNQIWSDALCAVYLNMFAGSSKCFKLESDLLSVHFYYFLISIGIIIGGGYVFANRYVQAYLHTRNGKDFCSIFDGKIELKFSDYRLPWYYEMHFVLKLHESD
ncbi:hypothetical protein PMAYCL1PPCAC_01464, partial [Pristionchus mayeri]